MSSRRRSTRAAFVAKRWSAPSSGRADHIAQPAEEPVVGGGHRNAAGSGFEVLVRHDVRMRVSVTHRVRSCDQGVLGHVDQCRQAAVEQRHLNPGALASVQRGQHGGGRVQPGEHVDQRHAHLVGRALLGPRDGHQAGLGLGHEVVARAPLRLATRAEARDRAVDHRGVLGPHLVVAHPEPLRPADLEVLDHGVRPRTELERELPALGLGEVEGAAALAPVHRQVVGGLAAHERRAPGARLVAALGTLDLDHVRPEVGQDHRAVGAGQHPREIGDAHAGERCGGLR